MEHYGYQKNPEDKKVEVEAEATAKATAVNKNWNVQYANIINRSNFAENELEKYAAAAADSQKAEDLISKLKDQDDGETNVEAEAKAKATGKAIIRNKNINQIFVDTKNNDVYQ